VGLSRTVATAVAILLAMSSGAAVGDQYPTDCVALRQRRVDDSLSTPEIDAIERQVRRVSDDPIIRITFERRKRSGFVDRVQVRLLDHCNEGGAGGHLLQFRRLKSGWRLDRRRDGRWASVRDVVY